MGDRGSICIVDEGPDPRRSRIYLYTQRAGWLLPAFLQQALTSLAPFSFNSRPDAMSVSHHVYVEMLEQEEGIPLRDRSFGISSGLVDNERPVLTVYVEEMTISLHDVEDRPTGRSWSFEEFLRLDLADEPWSVISPELEPGAFPLSSDRTLPATVSGNLILEAIRALSSPTAREIAMELERRGIPLNEGAIPFLAIRAGASANAGADGEKRYSAPNV